MVRTSGFHPGNRGSIPRGITIGFNTKRKQKAHILSSAEYALYFQTSDLTNFSFGLGFSTFSD